MTVETAPDDTAVPLSAGVTTLPPEHLACRDCGVAVAPPHAPETVETITAYAIAGERLPQTRRGMTWECRVTRCVTCVERSDRARTLLEAHPLVRARSGSMSIAMHQAGGALSALAAIGVEPPALDTDRDLARLITDLKVPGLTARWVAGLAPVVLTGRTLESCAAHPWSHLTGETLADLRRAYAGHLQRSIETQRRYRPPAATTAALAAAERAGEVHVAEGCLACGVGSILALPSRSGQVWTEASITPGALGGKAGRTTRITGYLCGPCERAHAEAGAYGPTAWGRALIASFNLPSRRAVPPDLDGIVCWGVQAEAGQRTPNREPWAHLDGLDELREALK